MNINIPIKDIYLPFVTLWNWWKKRGEDQEKMFWRIVRKYYPLVEKANEIYGEVGRVSQDNLGHLREVNILLCQFEDRILNVPNTGSIDDLSNKEIRKIYSDNAVKCLQKLMACASELNKEVMNPDCWQYIRSKVVRENSAAILSQWNKVMEIMARKRFMLTKNLWRDLLEWSNGE